LEPRVRRTAVPLALLVLLPLAGSAAAAGGAVLPTAGSPGAPTFTENHGPASPLDARGRKTGADSCGEPSLGVNKSTPGGYYYMCSQSTWTIAGISPTADDKGVWTDVTDPLEGAQTSDPILYTDPTTGRTWVDQLILSGNSVRAYTDDGGKTYTRNTIVPGIAFDHQTIGTGKYSPKSTLYKPGLTYPNAFYYCTNDLAAADCAVSTDSGVTFGPQVPVDKSSPCSKIVGHIKTDPNDGTVYLPPDGCGTQQGVYVSHDNTQTWALSTVPGSTVGDSGHPSIATGKDGTVYYAYGTGDVRPGKSGRTHVAVSTDQGATWASETALGADKGILASRFPTMVAGDGDRAAVAFLGSTAEGDPGAIPDATAPTAFVYPGSWDLYVSYTVDRGQTWTTYDATPGKPVQVGPVCTAGTTCTAGRNLLDFNDMVVGTDGRVAIAMADGNLAPGDTYAKGLAKGDLVRQTSGPSLFAASDTTPATDLPEIPLPAVLPLVGIGFTGLVLARRRRRTA